MSSLYMPEVTKETRRQFLHTDIVPAGAGGEHCNWNFAQSANMRINNTLALRTEAVWGISLKGVIWIFIFTYVSYLFFLYHRIPDASLSAARSHERVWLREEPIQYREIPRAVHKDVYIVENKSESETWRLDFLKMATRELNSTLTSSRPLENSILGPTHIQQVAAGVWHMWEPEGVAFIFLQYVTRPSAFCRRLIKVGGSSCLRRQDGDKVVCMDPRLGVGRARKRRSSFPSGRASCLVFSVGIGHDLSFDRAMARLACSVHAFDDDDTYKFWSMYQGPGLAFHRGRLGTQTRNFTFCDLAKGVSSCRSYRHYTLQALRTRLGYGTAPIHFLKVDIEGAEWEVLQQALQKGWLEEVEQLAVEIHLEDLRDPTFTSTQRRDVVAFYLQVFASLEASGLSLASFTPNTRNPEITQLDGVPIPCYAELLWIRR